MKKEIPTEEKPLRRVMGHEELHRLFRELDLAKRPFSFRWGIRNRLRLQLWLNGQEDIPGWMPAAMVAIKALVALRVNLAAGVNRELLEETAAAALDELTGNRFDHRVGPEPPAFVCPVCGTPSWNLNDGRQGYCGRCHKFTADDMTYDPRQQDEPPELDDHWGSDPRREDEP
jgi:hypothetical protein